jgi:hypothetical protein
MFAFARDVGALTAAYELTREERYAAAAVQQLRVWFVDPATRLNPNLQYAQSIQGVCTGRGTGLIDTVHLAEVALGLRARRLEYPAYGYALRSGELYLRWKADLGRMIRSMRGFYLTTRLGLGLELYLFADAIDRTPGLFDASSFQSGFFTVASGAEVNAGRRTHVGALYVQDPTGPVAAASAETGALNVFLRHRYRDDLEIDVDVFAGDGWVVWLGLGYGL